MKRLFLITNIITLFCIQAFSQEPLTPELCLVTVKNDSLVFIKWYYDDSESIDGFIIKRVIYDGEGVISGTINNIEVVYNPYLRSYTDTSFDYSTRANPYIRSEYYSVNAFIVRNDSIIFSNMTPQQNSVFLTANWDECSGQANLSWTAYENRNVQKYEIFYGFKIDELTKLTETMSNQTFFSTNDLISDTTYFFKINAVLSGQFNCTGDTSVSNIDTFYTYIPKKPKNFVFYNASSENNSQINLNFNVEKSSGLKNYELYRNADLLKIFSADNLIFSYNDVTNVLQENTYRIDAIDICDNAFVQSNFVKNIVLNVEKEDRSFYLHWNETTLAGVEPQEYEIYIDLGSGFELIDVNDYRTLSKRFDFYDIFKDLPDLSIQQVCFKVKATPKNGNFDTLFSFSNEVCLPLTGILAIPNAFNPLSNKPENSFFIIKGLFIEYFHITIFSETGMLLFESDDINNSWSGRTKQGDVLPKGAYIYYIEYISTNGIKEKINGIINIVY